MMEDFTHQWPNCRKDKNDTWTGRVNTVANTLKKCIHEISQNLLKFEQVDGPIMKMKTKIAPDHINSIDLLRC